MSLRLSLSRASTFHTDHYLAWRRCRAGDGGSNHSMYSQKHLWEPQAREPRMAPHSEALSSQSTRRTVGLDTQPCELCSAWGSEAGPHVAARSLDNVAQCIRMHQIRKWKLPLSPNCNLAATCLQSSWKQFLESECLFPEVSRIITSLVSTQSTFPRHLPQPRQQRERLTHTAGWSSAFKDTVTKMRGTFDLRREPCFTYSALAKPRTLWACECVLGYFQVHFLNAMRKISWEGGPGFTSVLSQEEKGNTMNFSWAGSPSVQWDIFACLEAAFDLIWGGSGPTLVNTVMIVIKGFHVSIHEWSKVYILNDFCALTNTCFAKLCAWRSVNWA